MASTIEWIPPGKNCGMCGHRNCGEFLRSVRREETTLDTCPYHSEVQNEVEVGTRRGAFPQLALREAAYDGKDVLRNDYDFILLALPGELSPRKIVLPFRPDLVDILDIKAGDYVIGRPAGAGCPISHVLEVIDADRVTGVLTTWVVGPKVSREREVKEVKSYHMLGFEGIAAAIRKAPVPGCRMTFLPGCCMMNLNHTGLVNMVLEKKDGLMVRVEDIRILAGVPERE